MDDFIIIIQLLNIYISKGANIELKAELENPPLHYRKRCKYTNKR